MRKYKRSLPLRGNRRNSKKQIPKNKSLIKFFLVFVFVFFVFIIFKVITVDKFIYVNKTEVGDAEIIGNTFRYKIPADTKLNSARGYGEYKVSSLWSLSEKDNNGRLVPETIAKNYFLPVSYWKNKTKSNLNIYQKISIFFDNKSKNIVSEINSTKLSNSVLIQFVNPEFEEVIPKIEVEDLTNSLNTLDKVSKIIEVAGGKITSNSKGYDADLDCEIYGKNLKFIRIFSAIFSCDEKVDITLTTDLKIRLGAKFSERF